MREGGWVRGYARGRGGRGYARGAGGRRYARGKETVFVREAAVERPRHIQDSQGRGLAVAFKKSFENLFNAFPLRSESHLQTLIIYKLGFNQNYCIFTSILLIKIVRCSKFP